MLPTKRLAVPCQCSYMFLYAHSLTYCLIDVSYPMLPLLAQMMVLEALPTKRLAVPCQCSYMFLYVSV